MNDPRGNPVSAVSAQALEASERALWRMMSFYGTPIDDLDAAIAAEPAWPLPRLMKAGFLLSLTEPSVVDDARALVASVPDSGEGSGNARERAHRAALVRLSAGDWAAAADAWSAILREHPRDAPALQWAHLFDFYRGDLAQLAGRVAPLLAGWPVDDPLHPYVLALHAFGLEESGRYAEAEATGRRALAADARVPWAIHAVAHVMEMQGRTREGIDWLQRPRGEWSRNAAFAVHLAWHLALFRLDNDEPDAALSIYDRALVPTKRSSMAALVDASALLWRLDLHGVRVQRRARQVARHWSRKRLSGVRAFNLVHATAAFAAARHHRTASQVIGLLRNDPATRRVNRPMDLALAIPVCEAIAAFARGKYALAVEKINVVRALAADCGGSIAQCDLIHLTLLEAALRSRRMPLAHALATERAARKPRSLLNRWLFARAATAA